MTQTGIAVLDIAAIYVDQQNLSSLHSSGV
jgi:hypothetical protein